MTTTISKKWNHVITKSNDYTEINEKHTVYNISVAFPKEKYGGNSFLEIILLHRYSLRIYLI
jgi:hypothetical protein